MVIAEDDGIRPLRFEVEVAVAVALKRLVGLMDDLAVRPVEFIIFAGTEEVAAADDDAEEEEDELDVKDFVASPATL